MRKTIITLSVVLAAALVLAAFAFAATPKLPASFSGNYGGGAPVRFKLDRHGRATYALLAFTCKQISGIGTASSKHPSGKLKNGKITITYSGKSGIVKAQVKMVITFTSKTTAKGTATISSAQCTAPKIKFTATAK